MGQRLRERSSVWLEYLLAMQRVRGSNPLVRLKVAGSFPVFHTVLSGI